MVSVTQGHFFFLLWSISLSTEACQSKRTDGSLHQASRPSRDHHSTRFLSAASLAGTKTLASHVLVRETVSKFLSGTSWTKGPTIEIFDLNTILKVLVWTLLARGQERSGSSLLPLVSGRLCHPSLAPLSVTAMFSLAVPGFAQSAQSYLCAYDLGPYHLDDPLEALPWGWFLPPSVLFLSCPWVLFYFVSGPMRWLPTILCIGVVPVLVLLRQPDCCGVVGENLQHGHAKAPGSPRSWR